MFKDPNGRFLILNAFLNDLFVTLVKVFGEIDKFNGSTLIVAGDINTVNGKLDYQGNKDQHSNINSSEMLSVIIDDLGLCDIWRNFHPNLRQYTRHQKTGVGVW